MDRSIDVSIIIVNYNTCEMTSNCIESIYNFTKDVNIEIILVDNHSSDNSVNVLRERYSNLRVVENQENLGFGRANNVGAKIAQGKYLFFLNSDTLLIDNSIKVFFSFMESHQEIASCGCNLISKEGANTVCHGCLPTLRMEFFTVGLHKFFRNYYDNRLSYCQTIKQGNIHDTGYLSGADIFIRTDEFRKVGEFDKKIFMYYEETDLFYRMKNKGLKTCLLPQIKIIHLGGASFGSRNFKRFEMSERSRMYYYRKHYGSIYTAFVKLARLLNIIVRPDKDNLKKAIIIFKS